MRFDNRNDVFGAVDEVCGCTSPKAGNVCKENSKLRLVDSVLIDSMFFQNLLFGFWLPAFCLFLKHCACSMVFLTTFVLPPLFFFAGFLLVFIFAGVREIVSREIVARIVSREIFVCVFARLRVDERWFDGGFRIKFGRLGSEGCPLGGWGCPLAGWGCPSGAGAFRWVGRGCP